MHIWVHVALVSVLTLSACVSPSAGEQPVVATPAPPPSPPPVVNTAVLPVSRDAEPLWLTYLQRISAEAVQQPDTGLLFLGDSITQGLRAHPELWQSYYGPFKPLNGGIWADSTQHLLWRLQHGTFATIDPKVVVLLIGVNNGQNTAAETAAGTAANVHAALAQFPHAKILVLGIFPYGKDPHAASRQRCNEANRLVSQLADGQRIFYLDLGSHFVDQEGHILTSLFRGDALHLSKQGYEVWADAMQPELSRLWTRGTSPPE